MMYVFICTECGRVRMVSGLREAKCPSCETMMAVGGKSFLEWTVMSDEQRKQEIKRYCTCKDKEKLLRYRPMPKYDRVERGY